MECYRQPANFPTGSQTLGQCAVDLHTSEESCTQLLTIWSYHSDHIDTQMVKKGKTHFLTYLQKSFPRFIEFTRFHRQDLKKRLELFTLTSRVSPNHHFNQTKIVLNKGKKI